MAVNAKRTRSTRLKKAHKVQSKPEIVVQEAGASVPQMPVEIPMDVPPRKKPKSFFVWFGVAAVVVVLVGSTVYFYSQYQKTSLLLKNPTAQDAPSQLIAKVGALIMLPRELPTIATVSDVTKLSGQPFFAQAQNGDEVLIYQNSGQAILYRPSINKIISVAPLNTAPSTQTAQASSPQVAGAETTASPSATPTPQPMRVVLYNGTTTVGLTKTVKVSLATKLPQVTVVGAHDAKGNYDKTVVIDLTGTRSADAQALSLAVNGVVESLPTGEVKPTAADFLVIVGSNYVAK